jgi:outer membrane protein assembly factor BamA
MRQLAALSLPLLFLFFLISLIPAFSDDTIQLLRVEIEGNKVTSEDFIRSMITLQQGQVYDLDAIIDEINISRENLEKTGLFATVFFDDELDEENNLVITVRLREDYYFFFGLSGYFGYEDSEFYSSTSLYLNYINMGGLGSLFHLEVPFYRDYGVIVRYTGLPGKLQYMLGFDFRHDYFYDENVQKLTAGFGYNFHERFLLGLDVESNRESPVQSSESTLSFVFFPYIRWGLVSRYTEKQKKWHSLFFTPYAGINVPSQSGSHNTQFYGFDSRLSLNWDVLLQIVYTLNVHVSFQDGTIPNEYRVRSNIRGTYYDAHAGSYRLTVINNLDFPWPTDNRIHLVPFLDYGVVSDGEADFLLGGGLGLHWYTKYQDPLVFEVAYGEGLMINLSKNF